MNDRQENKLGMAKTVQLTFANNADIIATPPAFAAAKTELDNKIASIDAIAQAQSGKITGTAKDKEQAEDAGIATALALIGPAQSYAREQNNNTLFDSLNYKTSGLKKLRDTVLPQTLTQIRDVLQANVDSLTDYGITADDITNFSTQIAAITLLQGTPRNAITTKAAATKALKTEFKNLDVILERLDGFAVGKKAKYPDFYNAYQAARVIVDTKGKGKGDNGGGTNPAT